MPEQNGQTAGIDFLDFLFTVAISVGMTPELVGEEGLLSSCWHEANRWPNPQEWFDIGVFALGFLNLTLSWFGYHASILRRPLNYTKSEGMYRFILDVILVVAYGIMLIEYRRFEAVLVLLVLVHLIFVIWDYIKVREYREEYTGDGRIIERYRRELVSVFAFLFVLTSTIIYFMFGYHRWLALLAAIFITVFYRYNKNHPTWERLFGVR